MTDTLRHRYIRAALSGLLANPQYNAADVDLARLAVDFADGALLAAGHGWACVHGTAFRDIRDMAHGIATGKVVAGSDAQAVARHIETIAKQALGEPL